MLLSNVAFNVNQRPYSPEGELAAAAAAANKDAKANAKEVTALKKRVGEVMDDIAAAEAKVGWCRLNPIDTR